MKRLTALVLAGVMLFGTACGGGNQTNGTAGNADAGAASVQEQTADSAGDAEATTEGAANSAEDTADGEKGDAIIIEDENAFSGDGTVTAFIGEPFYDGVIKDYSDAYEAVLSVYDRIGADETTDLELAEVRPTEDNICYTFYQMAGDIRVYGNAVKLITDNDGKAIGLVSAILPNVKAAQESGRSLQLRSGN